MQNLSLNNCSYKYMNFILTDLWYLSFQILFGLPVIVCGIFCHSIIILCFRKKSQIVYKVNVKIMMITFSMSSEMFLLSMIPKLFADKFINYVEVLLAATAFGEMYRLTTISLIGILAFQRLMELLNVRYLIAYSNKRSACLITAVLIFAFSLNYNQLVILTEPLACDNHEIAYRHVLGDVRITENYYLFIYTMFLLSFQSTFIVLLILIYLCIYIYLNCRLGKVKIVYNTTDKPESNLITDNMRDRSNNLLFLIYTIFIAPMPIVQLIISKNLSDMVYLKFQIAIFYIYTVSTSVSALPFILLIHPVTKHIKVLSTIKYWKDFVGLSSLSESLNSDTLKSLASLKKSDDLTVDNETK
uniref:GCR141 n=1 Tax=Schmidtea mediterranea TaxID=79327 RepID=A0A193KUE5_SCHMD|nr:GCR141 [Schmidtea mediterranea]